MTANEKIWTKHESRRLGLEKRWKTIIEKAGLNSIEDAANATKESEFIWFDNIRHKVKGGELAFVLLALNIQVAVSFAYKSNRQLMRTKSIGDDLPDRWIETTIAYFKEHNLQFLRDINESTRDKVISTLMKSQELGLGADERARLIMKEGFSKVRALRIARTETVRAANYGNLLSAIESDLVLKKKWIAHIDKRTRHSHRYELNGKTIDLYEDFKVGLMFPGDPNAAAEETINCRCSLGMVPQRNEDGTLMKKPQMVIRPGGKMDFKEDVEQMIAFINDTPTLMIAEIVSSEIFKLVKSFFEKIGLLTVFNKLFE